ncbi:hypothetical protein Plim_2898 [Planctopirus limnophila DSM 3776]|uniref:Uncharacterized protein n=1 Tax=Planctopirus limnophila (strain ATCC 43296 / DSM 3776 / IFAM 1008 / Mu 290) TaxID=521674 RepID=D5SRZ6_PLAL2|nr:hypothetical protein [Planctopirus limnophila]ADG68720.1 hypothetical protein Plim_2898 [Planctopirus limnophila DSM 3776]
MIAAWGDDLSLYLWSLLAGLPLAYALVVAVLNKPESQYRSISLWYVGCCGLFCLVLIKWLGLPQSWFLIMLGPAAGCLLAVAILWLNSRFVRLSRSELKLSVSKKNASSSQVTYSERLSILMALVLAVVLPWQMTTQRVRTWADLAVTRMHEGRFVAAYDLLDRIDQLSGPRTASTLLPEMSRLQLEAQIRQVVQSVNSIEITQVEDQLHKVRLLLGLDEFELAEELLAKILRDHPESFEGYELTGLMYQFREHWSLSERSFLHAVERVRPRENRSAAGNQIFANLSRLWSGAAYAARKRGAFDCAENYYLKALEIAPGSDKARIHYVFAQFLEESQQSMKAAEHARQAALLEPALYQVSAQELLQRLRTAHLGCFLLLPSLTGD